MSDNPHGRGSDPTASTDRADTSADETAMAFLNELDEALWLLTDAQQVPMNTFERAARKAAHIADFRRLLYRLHVVLAEWEQQQST
jgi:hypothetical protein